MTFATSAAGRDDSAAEQLHCRYVQASWMLSLVLGIEVVWNGLCKTFVVVHAVPACRTLVCGMNPGQIASGPLGATLALAIRPT